MATVTWTLEADFNQDGLYSADITADVEKHAGVLSIKRGLNEEGVYQIAQVTLGLGNTTGKFSPENSAGTYYGKIRSGVPMRFKATHSAVTYTLFTAFAQRWKPKWSSGRAEKVSCTLYDLAWYIRNFNPINVAASQSRTTDQALQQIATNMGLADADVSFATGQQTLALHWARSQDAMSAMMGVCPLRDGRILVG